MNPSILKTLDTNNTAILVIDKQRGYFDRNNVFFPAHSVDEGGLADSLKKIDSLIEQFRQISFEVAWTQMIEDLELSPKNIRDKMASSDTPSISTPTEPSFEIVGLKPKSNEKVFVKKSYDAFANQDLVNYLKFKSIENIIFVGGFASRCVLGSAFGANGKGFNVYAVEGLVVNPPRFIDELPAAFSIIDSILGYIVTKEDLISHFKLS